MKLAIIGSRSIEELDLDEYIERDSTEKKGRKGEMGKYFIIGIPNCGKSTLGRLAADITKGTEIDIQENAVRLYYGRLFPI